MPLSQFPCMYGLIRKTMKRIFLLIIMSLMLAGCSKDNDPVDPPGEENFVLQAEDIQIVFRMFSQSPENLYTAPVPGPEGGEDFPGFIQKNEPQLLPDLFNMYNLPN